MSECKSFYFELPNVELTTRIRRRSIRVERQVKATKLQQCVATHDEYAYNCVQVPPDAAESQHFFAGEK